MLCSFFFRSIPRVKSVNNSDGTSEDFDSLKSSTSNQQRQMSQHSPQLVFSPYHGGPVYGGQSFDVPMASQEVWIRDQFGNFWPQQSQHLFSENIDNGPGTDRGEMG